MDFVAKTEEAKSKPTATEDRENLKKSPIACSSAAAAEITDEVEIRPYCDTIPPPKPPKNTETNPQTSQQETKITSKTLTTSLNPMKFSQKTPAVNVRQKFALGAGFGLMDWVKLKTAAKDLSQRRGQPIRQSIPMSEIATHNTMHDCWCVIHNKVYNLSPYFPYHPGGSQIFKNFLGKDATKAFDKYHRWVNIEGLVGVLYLGNVEKGGKKVIANDDDEN